ncbi:MAG: hypothetical protein IKA13_07965, partial [Bacteroidales bacterium]|nr:hypothetical protein [Bacteroidales bacterium]
GKTSSTTTLMDFDEDDELPSQSFKHNYTQGSNTTLSSSDFNYVGTYANDLKPRQYALEVPEGQSNVA